MKLIITGVILSLAFSQCSAQISDTDLEGTQWEYVFNSESKDYIKFYVGNKYEAYSAEAMTTEIGVYFFRNDTLNLVSVKDVDDDHRFVPGQSKAVIKNNQLRYVGFEDIKKGKWLKSDYTPPDYYFFTKNQ